MPWEIAKFYSSPSSKIKKFINISNPDLIYELLSLERGVMGLTAHIINWEMPAFALPIWFPDIITGAAYRRASFQLANDLILAIRKKNGFLLIEEKHLLHTLLKLPTKKWFISIISDQTPLLTQSHLWHEFLGINTPFFAGWIKISKKLNAPIVYGQIHKEGFCKYVITFHTIATNPIKEDDNTLLKKYIKFVTYNIINMPHLWLWTHRRWKRIPNFYEDS